MRKSNHQDEEEPQACPDSMQKDQSKIRLLKAQEIIQHSVNQSQDDGEEQAIPELDYVKSLEIQNQEMYNRLLEADDIIHELTRLVDISRNKQLQKKLLTFADASL